MEKQPRFSTYAPITRGVSSMSCHVSMSCKILVPFSWIKFLKNHTYTHTYTEKWKKTSSCMVYKNHKNPITAKKTGFAIITWNNPKQLEKPCITKGEYLSIFGVDFPEVIMVDHVFGRVFPSHHNWRLHDRSYRPKGTLDDPWHCSTALSPRAEKWRERSFHWRLRWREIWEPGPRRLRSWVRFSWNDFIRHLGFSCKLEKQ